MRTPIDLMLDGVEWKVVDVGPGDGSLLPHVTHEGELHVFDTTLRCYRLSDGKAIFDAEDFQRLLLNIGFVEPE